MKITATKGNSRIQKEFRRKLSIRQQVEVCFFVMLFKLIQKTKKIT